MAGFPVRHDGTKFEDYHFTMNLASGITAADVGKAVEMDTVANTVKLATDGSKIWGRLETFEDRGIEGIKVGTVARRFIEKLPIKSGQTVIVGNTAVGAGAGEIKAAVSADHDINTVLEIQGTYAVVAKI